MVILTFIAAIALSVVLFVIILDYASSRDDTDS
jgi:hypothetical protein